MINKVEISGVNTAKLPVLSLEEKNELLKRIKNGDEEARRVFINGNLMEKRISTKRRTRKK